MKKIKSLIKKIWTKETILYFVFGVLTTLVNIITSTVLLEIFKIEGNLASTIGIILSILFAYFTNRKIVFNSQAKGIKDNFKEFLKFIFGRAFTMVLEVCGVYLLYSVIGIQYLLSKLVMTAIVIITNYFISKFFAFKKNNYYKNVNKY